jgi:hypothetical protein
MGAEYIRVDSDGRHTMAVQSLAYGMNAGFSGSILLANERPQTGRRYLSAATRERVALPALDGGTVLFTGTLSNFSTR